MDKKNRMIDHFKAWLGGVGITRHDRNEERVNTLDLHVICMANTPKHIQINYLEFCERHGIEEDKTTVNEAHKVAKYYYQIHQPHTYTIEQ